jgi:hypothetical protein
MFTQKIVEQVGLILTVHTNGYSMEFFHQKMKGQGIYMLNTLNNKAIHLSVLKCKVLYFVLFKYVVHILFLKFIFDIASYTVFYLQK